MNISFINDANIKWLKDSAMLAGWKLQGLPDSLQPSGFFIDDPDFVRTTDNEDIPQIQVYRNIVAPQNSHNFIIDPENHVLIETTPSLTPEESKAGEWIIFENDTEANSKTIMTLLAQ